MEVWRRGLMSLSRLIRLANRLCYDYDHKLLVQNETFRLSQDVSTIPQSDRYIILQEIFDVQAAQLTGPQLKVFLSNFVQIFKLDVFQILEYFETRRFPADISLTRKLVSVGRYAVSRFINSDISFENLHNFALTDQTTRMMQQILGCVENKENLLLVGPTGIGKTYTLDVISKAIGVELKVINLSGQSEVTDLAGGYKPADVQSLVIELYGSIMQLYSQTTDAENQSNKAFIEQFSAAYCEHENVRVRKLAGAFVKALLKSKAGLLTYSQQDLAQKAGGVIAQLSQLEVSKQGFFFKYKDGILLQALKQGHFVLLDEINLAPGEVLEYVESILENDEICVTNQRSNQDEMVQKHPNFRLFASMNPANDVGKKQLPDNLQRCFTTFYVNDMSNYVDLRILCDKYVSKIYQDTQSIVELFLLLKGNMSLKTISNQTPKYSIRQLCRALKYANYHYRQTSPLRALYDGFYLFFTSNLDIDSMQKAMVMIKQKLNITSNFQYVDFKPDLANLTFLYPGRLVHVLDNIYFPLGNLINSLDNEKKSILENQSHFIITNTNKHYIKVIINSLLSKTSILLEGVTSSGKSSLILFLAKQLGYNVIRINNHENIDLQDYLGSFQPDERTGKLCYKYGPLIQAMKQGSWVILDELNLCSTEILESLNRLLDDNGEIYLPETNEIIKPQPGFALFATQNPSGLVNGTYYGGRKALSEAFKNRFVVLEVAEPSIEELKYILSNRSSSKNLAPKFIDSLIIICTQLKLQLQHTLSSYTADLVSQLITLRDLFRIADRLPSSILELGLHIFMLIGEKQRSQQLRQLVFDTINKALSIQINEQIIQQYYFDFVQRIITLIQTSNSLQQFRKIVFTSQFTRMLALTLIALRFQENICLVGDCGSGKTQVAELCAALLQTQMMSINLHKNSDVSDFVGQLRPLRNRRELQQQLENYKNSSHESNFYSEKIKEIEFELQKLFQWYDGPLIQAMTEGKFLLIDEISLANDAILERLNAVFESSRELTVAEKPQCSTIKANNKFKIVSTMNPGGDFGKKELSPALRNRMTEVYVQSIQDPNEVRDILQARQIIKTDFNIIDALVTFFCVVKEAAEANNILKQLTFSIRDVISISDHINDQFKSNPNITPDQFINIVKLCYLDGLQIKSYQLTEESCTTFIQFVQQKLFKYFQVQQQQLDEEIKIFLQDNGLNFQQNITNFSIPLGPQFNKERAETLLIRYNLNAPTTAKNAIRVAQAIINSTCKPILLESSPGVGKTSLIKMIAEICGYQLIRVNLSEHIDLSDLVGNDIPKDSSNDIMQFEFIYGPVVRAIVSDSWLLLDELNLASQSVLEGLNSLLDHRKQLYVSDIDKTFYCSQQFKLFAAQNPYSQGGGRKQLPQSFLNRFLCIYLKPLMKLDYEFIISHQNISQIFQQKLLAIFYQLQQKCNLEFGHLGGPWEINMRDVLRIIDSKISNNHQFMKYIAFVLIYKFRTRSDIESVLKIIQNIVGEEATQQQFPIYSLHENLLHCGVSGIDICNRNGNGTYALLSQDAPIIEALMYGIQNKISILFTSYKSQSIIPDRVVQSLSDAVGQKIVKISLALSTDVTDLIGQFEQVSTNQEVDHFLLYIIEKLQQSESETHQQQTYIVNLLRDESITLIDKADRACDYIVQQQFPNTNLSKDVSSRYDSIKSLLNSNQKQLFAWRDGVITRAVELGQWIYVKDVNFCQPSVLDRLNSLLERESCLYIFEQGEKELREVRIHPNFRIIMQYNCQYGEISRAIRNRCLELCVDNFPFINETLFNPGRTNETFDRMMNCPFASGEYLETIHAQRQFELFNKKLPPFESQSCALALCSVERKEITKAQFTLLRAGDAAERAQFIVQYNTQDSIMSQVVLQVLVSEFAKKVGGKCSNECVRRLIQCGSVDEMVKMEAEKHLTNYVQKYNEKNNGLAQQILMLGVPFKSELSKLVTCEYCANQAQADLIVTAVDEAINKAELQQSQIARLRSIANQRFMQSEISVYAKLVLSNMELGSQNSKWLLFRLQTNFSNFVIHNYQEVEEGLKSQKIGVYNNTIKFESALKLPYFLLYQNDDISTFLKDKIDEKFLVPQQMIIYLISNFSHFNKYIVNPQVVFKNPISLQIFNNLDEIHSTTINSIENQEIRLKESFNTYIQKQQKLFKTKFDVMNQNICLLQRILNQSNQNEYNTNSLEQSVNFGLSLSFQVFNIMNPSHSIDPTQQYQMKSKVYEDMIVMVDKTLSEMQNLQIITEARESSNYLRCYEINVKMEQYKNQLLFEFNEVKDKSIKRNIHNQQFYYDFCNKINDINISSVQEQIEANCNTQILTQLETNIFSFMQYILEQEFSILISYVDIIVPVIYGISCIAFFSNLKQMQCQPQQTESICHFMINSYYQQSCTMLEMKYLSKVYNSCEKYIMDLALLSIPNNQSSFIKVQSAQYDINLQNLAQIAASYEQSYIHQYNDYLNVYSPFRTRLQSKTGAEKDDKEDLDDQIDQLFGFEKQNVQIAQQTQIIWKIGRKILDFYCKTNIYCENEANKQKLIYSITQLFINTQQHETFNDYDLYIILMDMIKQSFDLLQHETSAVNMVMNKVKTNKSRRSQVCKNIYTTPYPSEVYNFVINQNKSFQTQLSSLLSSFEDNAKLLQIYECIQQLHQIQVFEEPLIHALTILENIITLALEWNAGAPQIYKFNEEVIQSLKKQAIHWRRIELMSWNSFFDDIKIEQQNQSLILWPELLLGALSASNRVENEYKIVQAEFIKQYKQFLYNCQIGQFEIRRNLIFAISQLVMRSGYACAQKVTGQLLALVYESSELCCEINGHIAEQHKELIAQFTNQVKLFQWDERSFYTLRKDSKKSHALVLQIMKKYNEVFQMPTPNYMKQAKATRFIIKAPEKVDTKQDEMKVKSGNDANINDSKSSIDYIVARLQQFHSHCNEFSQQKLIFKQIITDIQQEFDLEHVDIAAYDYDSLLIQCTFSPHAPHIQEFMQGLRKFQDALLARSTDLDLSDICKVEVIVKLMSLQFFSMIKENMSKSVGMCQSDSVKQFIQRSYSTIVCSQKLLNVLGKYMSQEIQSDLSRQADDFHNHLCALCDSDLEADEASVNQFVELCIAIEKTVQSLVQKCGFEIEIFNPILRIVQPGRELAIRDRDKIIGYPLTDAHLLRQTPNTFPHVPSKLNVDEHKQYTPQIVSMLACIVKSGFLAVEKQQPDRQKEKQQQKQQDGTGLGDAAGEKDITEQVKEENLQEDDLIGNDREDNEGEKPEENDKDNGIDMEQEFGGEKQDLEKGEEGSEQQQESELDRDIGGDELEEKDKVDKRQGEEDDEEKQNQNKKEGEELQREQGLTANEGEESEKSQNIDDKPEQLNVQAEQPDEDIQNYEEVHENNASMQTQNEEDEISNLFNELFDEEESVQNEDDMKEQSQLEEKIEEVEQLFEQKDEKSEEQKEDSIQPEQNEVEIEIDDQQWANDEENKNKGFQSGAQNQNNEENQEEQHEEENSQNISQDNEKDNENKGKQKQVKDDKSKSKDEKDVKERVNKLSDKKLENQDENPINPTDNQNGDEQQTKANADNAAQNDQSKQQLLADKEDAQSVAVGDSDPEAGIAAEKSENVHEPPVFELPKLGSVPQTVEEIKHSQLVEQQASTLATRLKMLLEPTLNSNLIGDFRSGKKLNMRKIIPFIASGYRKDKIWLRRTKPEKRTYRLVVCVDNSFSVQDSSIVPQILNSIAIIFRAARLAELGKVAVCKFGAEFHTLYPLSDVFNELLFFQALEQLDFADKETNFAAMLEGAGQIFQSEIQGDQTKLQNILIVLTDGQVSEKERVGEMYRKIVRDQKALPIFLLYDKKVFEMTSVQFKTNEQGKRVITRKAYLEDEYPLQNFVVCAEQDGLIEALCSALVQFLQQML